ncbi:hypothetical protein ACHAO4_007318 [Trichoderma viride]
MSLNFLAWTFGLGPDLRRCYKYSYKDAHKALLQYEDEDEDEDVGSGPLDIIGDASPGITLEWQ